MSTLSLLSLISRLADQHDNGVFNNIEASEMSRLLSALASTQEMTYWSNYHQITVNELYVISLKSVTNHILNTTNDYHTLLLSEASPSSKTLYRKHYRLLMNIYHPDKQLGSNDSYNEKSKYCSTLISKAYKNIRQTNRRHSPTIDKRSNKEKRIKIKLRKTNDKQKNSYKKLLLPIIFLCALVAVSIFLLFNKGSTEFFYQKSTLFANSEKETTINGTHNEAHTHVLQ